MTIVSVTIPAMRSLVSGAEAAAAAIVDETGRIRSTMDGVLLDTSVPDTEIEDAVVSPFRNAFPIDLG